jgi:putative hydrolase of the HAD superfamily
MIKAVIFDYGGVVGGLINVRITQAIAEVFGFNKELVKSRMKKFIPLLDTGKISLIEFSKLTAASLDDESKASVVENIWMDVFMEHGKPNRDVVEIVKKLKNAGYVVALLTNAIIEHASIRKNRGDYKHFSPIILSYEVGIRKPDEEIYNLMLQKLNLPAEECVFIDDKKENVIVAEKLGINGIIFENAEQLTKQLKELGVNGV